MAGADAGTYNSGVGVGRVGDSSQQCKCDLKRRRQDCLQAGQCSEALGLSNSLKSGDRGYLLNSWDTYPLASTM